MQSQQLSETIFVWECLIRLAIKILDKIKKFRRHIMAPKKKPTKVTLLAELKHTFFKEIESSKYNVWRE